MDKRYLKALAILERTKEEIEYIFNSSETDSFEDRKAYQILENVIDSTFAH